MSWVERVLGELLKDGPRVVSLDEIGEAIGVEWATPVQIEELFGRLEESGASVGDPEVASLSPLLVRVLGVARELKARGQRIDPTSIAARAGLTPREVRVALLYGEVLSRGTKAARGLN